MRKIKIAFFVCGLDGGVGNVILNYFDHMPAEDYEVHIISNDVSSELYRNHYEKRGFRIIEIPKNSMNLLERIRYMEKIIRKNKYDIVHCHQTLTNIFPLYSAKKCGVKVRISHSHHVINPDKSMKDKALTFISRNFSRFLATDCMACGKDAGKSIFGDKNRFIVLNNALELEEYKYNEAVRKSEREKLNIGSEYVIGHVGRFASQKNHTFIVDIMSEVLKKNPDSKLLLIGEGELFDEIRKKISDAGISENVIMTGSIDDVPAKLQAMDIFILPSRGEGLPVVALEAQASGLPCVISENVTREVKVIPEVSYLSIDESPEKWSDEILKYRSVPRNKDSLQMLEKRGYAISKEARKLDRFYKRRVKSK